MSEGSLEAPIRHPIPWEDPDFYDEEKLDAELRRVFDICHGCRRCFNLCDSFPRLFDLIDESESGELDTVDSADFKPVVDACTLCDMCFMTKCPYVPPHEFDLDFPHLMLRYRAVERRRARSVSSIGRSRRPTATASSVAPSRRSPTGPARPTTRLTRPLMEKMVGIHRKAKLPKFNRKTFVAAAKADAVPPGQYAMRRITARKAAIFATCFVNYNNPEIGRPPAGCWRTTASKPRSSTRAAAACRSSRTATSRPWPRRRKRTAAGARPGSTRATRSSPRSRPAP
jgi:glycerol-3-phosphate dehydrogenase subunit C